MATITNLSSKKVLIVEDMPEVRNQLQMSMSSLGLEKLVVVATIKEAMEKFESIRFDVVLSDLSLIHI